MLLGVILIAIGMIAVISIIAVVLMADATTPQLVQPRTTLSSKIAGLKGQDFMRRTGPKMDKLSDDLSAALLNDVEEHEDQAATVDTDAGGDFFLYLGAVVTALTKLAKITPLDFSTPLVIVPFKNSNIFVLTGDVAGFDLTRFETLTGGTSAATLKLLFGADLTIGTARVVVARLLTGTPTPGGETYTGGSSGGTIITTGGLSTDNRNPGVGGRASVASTGSAHGSQTSVPIGYEVEGLKA